MKMTVGELIDHLSGSGVRDDMPIVIEGRLEGKDDRVEIHDIQKALYEGAEEIHLIAADGIRDK